MGQVLEHLQDGHASPRGGHFRADDRVRRADPQQFRGVRPRLLGHHLHRRRPREARARGEDPSAPHRRSTRALRPHAAVGNRFPGGLLP
eukprot:8982672-Alexandrium_andersonii.AAC.1